MVYTDLIAILQENSVRIVVDGIVNLVGSNNPPYPPTIEGSLEGLVGEEYGYTLCSDDPEGDDITYCIDFGDDSGEIFIGPYPSGICAMINHTWTEEGTYNIKAKAIDVYGAESNWTTFEVVMPQNQLFNIYSLFQKFDIIYLRGF